jgi:hypothetical protein
VISRTPRRGVFAAIVALTLVGCNSSAASVAPSTSAAAPSQSAAASVAASASAAASAPASASAAASASAPASASASAAAGTGMSKDEIAAALKSEGTVTIKSWGFNGLPKKVFIDQFKK